MNRSTIHHLRGHAGGVPLNAVPASGSHRANCGCLTCRQSARKAHSAEEKYPGLTELIAVAVREELARQRDDKDLLDDDPELVDNARPVFTNERAYTPPKLLLGGKHEMRAANPAELRALSGTIGALTDQAAYVPPPVLLAPRKSDSLALAIPGVLDRRRGASRVSA